MKESDILDQDVTSNADRTLFGTMGFILSSLAILGFMIAYLLLPAEWNILQTGQALDRSLVIAGASTASALGGGICMGISLLRRERKTRWKVWGLAFTGVLLVLLVSLYVVAFIENY